MPDHPPYQPPYQPPRQPSDAEPFEVFDKNHLVQIANQSMPFGRFKGRLLVDLPEEYLLWFVDRGFPAGNLGELMQLTLEIKINGLEALLDPLRRGR